MGWISSRCRSLRSRAFQLLLVLVACSSEAEDTRANMPDLRFRSDGSVDVVPYRATHDRSPDSVLAVFVNDTTSLPVLGARTVIGDTLRFTPRFSPSPGTKYVARYRARIPNVTHVTEWTPDKPSGHPSTVVLAIYPSADTVP